MGAPRSWVQGAGVQAGARPATVSLPHREQETGGTDAASRGTSGGPVSACLHWRERRCPCECWPGADFHRALLQDRAPHRPALGRGGRRHTAGSTRSADGRRQRGALGAEQEAQPAVVCLSGFSLSSPADLDSRRAVQSQTWPVPSYRLHAPSDLTADPYLAKGRVGPNWVMRAALCTHFSEHNFGRSEPRASFQRRALHCAGQFPWPLLPSPALGWERPQRTPSGVCGHHGVPAWSAVTVPMTVQGLSAGRLPAPWKSLPSPQQQRDNGSPGGSG